MARRAGPSVRSRRLAHVLRKQRVAAGLTAAELAKATGMSASKVSRFESCESGIYLDDLEKLLDFYQLSKKRRVELLDIARHAEERGWLRVRNTGLPDDWQTWNDFEDEASALLNYEPLGIPGLLQTSEYAREIIQATGGDMGESQVDVLVESRMARQGLLNRARPLRLHVIIEEMALRRPVHDDAVTSRQLRHLADAATRPNITVQVLSHRVGLHAGMSGPFVILQYDEDASLVLLENKVASLFLDEDEHIQTYADVWGDLSCRALEPGESIEVIKSLV